MKIDLFFSFRLDVYIFIYALATYLSVYSEISSGEIGEDARTQIYQFPID